jgi:hypothetical protein
MYKLSTFLFFFLSLSWLHGQDFLLLNLRANLFNTTEVCQSGDEFYGQFNLSMVNDSSSVLLHNNEAAFSTLTLDEWNARIEGKRVLFVVHGMAKGWSEANKDLCNVYWSLQQYTTDLYDVVIGVSWPGDSYLGISPYFRANRQSLKAAKLMGPIANNIEDRAQSLDIMTHSMGSKVMSKMIKNDKVHFDHAYLLAPSILRNSMKPLKRWRKTISHIDERLFIFHSNGDWAFNWTAMQHLGLGYQGMRARNTKRYVRLTQVNCDQVINQKVYSHIDRNSFSSRSNHSYYTQCPEVFHYIQSVANNQNAPARVVLQ